MLKQPIITLTTDFGLRDSYVAAVKGVLLRQCSTARIVDLSHSIAPQDVCEAALFLSAVIPYYPEDTIHLVVVDPGVGTSRHPIVARVGGHTVVCPDNGVLTLLLQELPLQEARIIEMPADRAATVSTTFHGRDVFAPAAAMLAEGAALSDIGPVLPKLETLSVSLPVIEGNHIQGEIIHVDHFGNCITNIRRSDLDAASQCQIHIGALQISYFATTYADMPLHSLFALIGSTERLEIAVRNGNAAQEYELSRGMPVHVMV